MPQEDIDYDVFRGIVDDYISRNGKPEWLMLQGEGESTLHLRFEDMLDYLKEKNINTRITTNGTYSDPDKFKMFTKVVVSIDSINQDKSISIGRMNTEKAMQFVVDLVARRINTEVVSVANTLEGVELLKVREWARSVGASYRIQELMTKPDYSNVYPITFFPLKEKVVKTIQSLKCNYIEKPLMEYYTVDGKKLPCCFIKDTSKFDSIEKTKDQMDKKIVPSACSGCNYLIYK